MQTNREGLGAASPITMESTALLVMLLSDAAKAGGTVDGITANVVKRASNHLPSGAELGKPLRGTWASRFIKDTELPMQSMIWLAME